jgi:molybdopterin-guanine dinucleotide biosynthesis protein A
VLSVLEGIFSEVFVVFGDEVPEVDTGKACILRDIILHKATAGGLFTGLSHATSDRIFAVGCDMPFLNPDVISRMSTKDPSSDVVMADLAHGLQPMHAFYSKRCLPVVEEMVKEGNLRLQEIVKRSELIVRLVPEDEMRSLDDRLLSFFNVNTPADLEFANKLLAS